MEKGKGGGRFGSGAQLPLDVKREAIVRYTGVEERQSELPSARTIMVSEKDHSEDIPCTPKVVLAKTFFYNEYYFKCTCKEGYV